MEYLTVDVFKAMLNRALEEIAAHEDEFSQLDAVIGDGDHGNAIVTALSAVVKSVSAATEFKSSGSTSTLLGAFFLGMSDCVSGTRLDVAGVKSMFAGGLAGVEKQTPAREGDKTMMDALIPAVTAIQNCNSNDIRELMLRAADAAIQGAKATVQMKANYGRARNYGERSVGYADRGASSWSTIFYAFAQSVMNN